MTPVSAIICTRNRPDLIGRAVASVLDNDYAVFDLTVVDQSTDDATEQALRHLAGDPRLHYHHIDRADWLAHDVRRDRLIGLDLDGHRLTGREFRSRYEGVGAGGK